MSLLTSILQRFHKRKPVTSDADKLAQISTLILEAAKTQGKSCEFAVLLSTVSAISNIINEFVLYDAKARTFSLTETGKDRLDHLVERSGKELH